MNYQLSNAELRELELKIMQFRHYTRSEYADYPIVAYVADVDGLVSARGYKRPSWAFKWADKELAAGSAIGFINMDFEKVWNTDGEWVGC